jgi:5-formyltetrahydrofolate cyclo-ligase
VSALSKSELRKQLLQRRRQLTEEQWAQDSALLCAQLLRLPCLQQARGVSLFWPLCKRHEPDLRALDAALRGLGKQLYYPGLQYGRGLFLTGSTAELALGAHGFWEPVRGCAGAAQGALQVIIAPALALTAQGVRLGYGAGFYDQVLPRYRPAATVVGVVYSQELLAELPSEHHDQRVDWIATPSAAYPAEP